tara:strand:+ start:403 stop:1509 length:1107 start_codon:yes stop_codon:yes gene_type:complete
MSQINFWDTQVGKKDLDFVKKSILLNYPNEGKFTKILENKIKKLLKVRYCLATPSCTLAIYLGLKSVGVGQKDEVLVPNLTFPATANAVLMSGAKVVLVDINPNTLNIDLKDLQKKINNKTKAIVPVHVTGRGCEVAGIKKIIKKKKKKIFIVEDAAEAFLSKKNNKYLGSHGDVGCFSLSPNKIFTSGQGGLLITNNKKIYNFAKVFKTQGRVGKTTGGNDKHISTGANLKFSNINAGLAISELNKVSYRKKKLIQNYNFYKRNLNIGENFKILKFNIDNGELPLWTDVLCSKRDELYEFLKKRKIVCRRFWTPLSKGGLYSNQKHNSFKKTMLIEKKAMWLPSSFLMTKKQQYKVINLIKNFYSKY